MEAGLHVIRTNIIQKRAWKKPPQYLAIVLKVLPPTKLHNKVTAYIKRGNGDEVVPGADRITSRSLFDSVRPSRAQPNDRVRVETEARRHNRKW